MVSEKMLQDHLTFGQKYLYSYIYISSFYVLMALSDYNVLANVCQRMKN